MSGTDRWCVKRIHNGEEVTVRITNKGRDHAEEIAAILAVAHNTDYYAAPHPPTKQQQTPERADLTRSGLRRFSGR